MVPAEVRRATELTADSEIVIRAEGEGRVVIETADAARKRVWAAAPSPDAARDRSATDSEEEVGHRMLEAVIDEDTVRAAAMIHQSNREGPLNNGRSLSLGDGLCLAAVSLTTLHFLRCRSEQRPHHNQAEPTRCSRPKNLFHQDLERDVDSPEFRAAFVRGSVKIATIDRIINALDDARLAQGLSKAELARAIGSNPSSIRRLFSTQGNPTLATLSDLAAVFGMRITLAPLPISEANALAGATVKHKEAPKTPSPAKRRVKIPT